MIKDFACKHTAGLWENQRNRKLPTTLQSSALRKLRLIGAATSIEDLKLPPGNRLEKLSGVRRGQHSIRINDQYRICLRFAKAHAHQVEITDYH